jgi:hypothetical protein
MMHPNVKKISLTVIIGLLLILSSCNSAPAQNILGSYFPAWMLCALIGILLTVIVYIIFAAIGIDEFIPAKLFTYLGLSISLTFITWLFWFGN